MDFRTALFPTESPFQIDYQDTILAQGSCFAEHIGRRLIDHKITASLNPFGILYNPHSLLAAESLVKQLDFVHYFPAYKLVLDDLRDYRFCEQDLAHPNELGCTIFGIHYAAIVSSRFKFEDHRCHAEKPLLILDR